MQKVLIDTNLLLLGQFLFVHAMFCAYQQDWLLLIKLLRPGWVINHNSIQKSHIYLRNSLSYFTPYLPKSNNL